MGYDSRFIYYQLEGRINPFSLLFHLANYLGSFLCVVDYGYLLPSTIDSRTHYSHIQLFYIHVNVTRYLNDTWIRKYTNESTVGCP